MLESRHQANVIAFRSSVFMWSRALKVAGLITLGIVFLVLFSTYILDLECLFLLSLDKQSSRIDYDAAEPFPAFQVSCQQLFSRIEHPELVRNLDLSKSDFCDDDMSLLVSKFPHLTGLNLRGTWIGDRSLDSLACLKDLRRLDLAFTHLTKDGLKRLSKFQKLQYLSLGKLPKYCDYSPSPGDFNIPLKNLKTLSLFHLDAAPFKDCSKLCSLHLNRTDDSVACLKQFACRDSLQTLTFEDCYFGGDTFVKLMSCFPNLKELAASRCIIEGSPSLTLNSFGHLETLVWRNCYHCDLNPTAIKESIAQYGLKTVELDDKSSVFALDKANELRSLTLFGFPTERLSLTRLSKLKHLSLNDTRLQESDYRDISTLIQLESLSLANCGFRPGSLKRLINLRNLKFLELSQVELNAEDLIDLSKLAHLKCLNLRNVRLAKYDLNFLDSIKGLEDLTIVNCGLTKDCIKKLKMMSGLKHLVANGYVSDVETLKEVDAIGGLEQILITKTRGKNSFRWKINRPNSNGFIISDHAESSPVRLADMLSGSTFPEDAFIDSGTDEMSLEDWGALLHLNGLAGIDLVRSESINDQVFSLLGDCKSLERICLQNSRISDQATSILPNLKKVTSLSLMGSNVTSKGLKDIATLTNLRSLSLAKTKVSDIDLQKLVGINLLHLDLSETKITNTALSVLGKCRSLQTINLYETNTTADGLIQLQNLRNLRVLWTGSNLISNFDIPKLAALKNLEYLTISSSVLTQWGEKEIRRRMPQTDIRFTIYQHVTH